MERCFNSKTYPDCHYIRIEITNSCGIACDAKIPKTHDEIHNIKKHCSAKPCQYGQNNRLCEIRNRLLDIQKHFGRVEFLIKKTNKNQPWDKIKEQAK